MIKKYAVQLGLMFSLSILFISYASAMSVDWSGGYRFEFIEVDKTSLDGDRSLRKSYLLNHLHLNPKIIASDGVNIVARFDVTPNSYYQDSQVGQTFGLGVNRSGTSSSTADSNVASDNQRSSYLQVSQLYLNINQEYGSIVVGRAPIHFGLGITYNAGNGAFDHWYDSRDMVGYKFIVGNFSLMPIVAKVYDYSLAQGREASDMIWNLEYNNPETESIFGVFRQERKSSITSNDAPVQAYGGAGASLVGHWSTEDVNLYIARGFESVKFRLEAGFRKGSTGIVNSKGDKVELNGYGVALETDFISDAKSQWSIKMGSVSGDNPETSNYEGYHFDRNYDVAFIMFNHPLGNYDLFRTYAQRNPDTRGCTATVAAPCAPGPTDEVADEETISNVMYFSPRYKRSINDKWDWTTAFTYAQLQAQPFVANPVAKDVGYELDIGFVYRPTERIQWVNEVGLFFPGGAFKGGTNDFKNAFTHGFQSKAAISF